MTVVDTSSNTSGHIRLLRNKGVTAVGRYYSTRAWKRITKPEATALSDADIEIFAVFEDGGDPELSSSSGIHDAQIALQQAVSIGQPQGSAIYFAMEHLPDGYNAWHLPGIRDYYHGLKEVLDGKYRLGVYSDGVVCDALLRDGLCEYAWLSASTAFPGSRDFDRSGRWALAQRRVDLNWSHLSIDTNDAKDDFGAFRLGVAAPVAIARSSMAAGTVAAAREFAPGTAIPAIPETGWTLLVRRLRTEKRASKPYARTIGTYQVYVDGQPVAGLAGMTVEREGPGDNGPVGKAGHRCIEAGTYPLRGHDTENYAIIGFATDGDHPRPAIEVGSTTSRTGILIHPASGYASTIGCINLASHLVDEDSNFSLTDSTTRVIALIHDLQREAGGALPREGAIANCRLIVVDPPVDQIGSQPLRLGSRGPLVRDWQAFLTAHGFTIGSAGADGSFGTGTRNGTIAFQKAHSLRADGAVGPRTIAVARQLGFGALPSQIAAAPVVGRIGEVVALTSRTPKAVSAVPAAARPSRDMTRRGRSARSRPRSRKMRRAVA
jgi:hypothetical protein